MGRKKKEQVPKFYESEELQEMLRDILRNCSNVFSHLALQDFKILFKNEKNKDGKKHVKIKILKEPITLTTNVKLLMIVGSDWFQDSSHSERVKEMIEALVGIMTDDQGNYTKRDFDVQTFSDLVKNPEYDFSKFSKVLPAEVKVSDLVLS